MIGSSLQQLLTATISKETGRAISSLQAEPVGGGCVNECYRLRTNAGMFFCKLNSANEYPSLFEKEKTGLELLAAGQVIKVPAVIALTQQDDRQVLILEWIEQGLRSGKFWQQFGKELAALHQQTSNEYGLDTDNYMGSLPQYNIRHHDWSEFFIHQRLEPQIKLATGSKRLSANDARLFENLYKKLPAIFSPEPPCLLHGDLWSGNFLCSEQEQPVLIDPATYYGHRSVDLAMTAMFGGFDRQFYDSYQHYYPLPPNYREQWEVCNLYPLLVHLNLFGQSYLPDILHTIKRY